MVHLYLKHVLAHFHAKRHSLVLKPAMGVFPKNGQFPAIPREMHMQEGFVGIAFREVSHSGQFVGSFLYCWWGVIVSDDGLVQWHTVQTGSHFSHRLYWICGTVNPWSRFYLWLKDVTCDHAIQGHTDGFFALNWYLAPCLLYRGDTWVYLDGVFSLQTADSVKGVWVHCCQLFFVFDQGAYRFMEYWLLSAQRQPFH